MVEIEWEPSAGIFDNAVLAAVLDMMRPCLCQNRYGCHA